MWTRRLERAWVVQDENGIATIDPGTGVSQATSELQRRLIARLAEPIGAGAAWSTSVDEPGGKRTLRVTFGDPVPARAPAWAFEPRAWANGPPPAPVR